MAKTLVDELQYVERYVECSAKTGYGVKTVFEDVVRLVTIGFPKEVKKRTVCSLF